MRKVLLDANLLLLLSVGAFDLRLVSSFKRISNFNVGDLELLRAFLRGREVVTTAHILTEVSNLGSQLPLRTRSEWLTSFAGAITRMEERHLPAVQIVTSPAFVHFGLTDAAIFSLCDNTQLVTEDGRLRSYLKQQGVSAIGLSISATAGSWRHKGFPPKDRYVQHLAPSARPRIAL